MEGFREAVQAARAETSDPSALATLQQALGATRPDGSTDWPTRVASAKTLLAAPEPQPASVVSVPEGAFLLYPDAIEAVLDEP